jgi:hypothetical protein
MPPAAVICWLTEMNPVWMGRTTLLQPASGDLRAPAWAMREAIMRTRMFS